MTPLKEKARGLAHRRAIRIETFATDGPHILVEGELHDVRTGDYFLFTGERRPGGTIHRMTARLLVNPETMVIEECELEMNQVPRPPCAELADIIGAVKGLAVTKGFSMKVRSLLGGAKGCAHVVSLLLEMGPAVLQGAWAIRSGKPLDKGMLKDKARVDRLTGVMKNTCRVWREDGPEYRKLMEELELGD
jgi:hypothetical protein